MSEDFDAYRKWLGIPPKEQPPHHYRLLGIAPFEDDADVIQNAADRQMAHIRTFQTGKHGTQSQKILNELATARGCLLDRGRKVEYDTQLRLRVSGENGTARDEKPEVAVAVPAAPPKPAPPVPRAIIPPPPAVAVVVAEPAVQAEYDPVAVATDESELGVPVRSARRSVSRSRPNSNPLMPLFIGGGLLGIVVVLGLIYAATQGGGKSNEDLPKTSDASKKSDSKPSTSVASVPAKSTTTVPRPELPRPDPSRPRFEPPRRPSETVDTTLPTSPEFKAPTAPIEPETPKFAGGDRVAFEIRAAREAMGRREMEDAKRHVIEAEYAAKDDAAKQKVAHVKALCAYLEEFWDAARKGVYQMKRGDSVRSPIGYQVEFEKVEGEMVSYKSNGRAHTDRITRVRTSAATVFAKKVLGDSEHAQYCVVAFLLLDRPSFGGRFTDRRLQEERLTKAKEIYQEVSRRGKGDPVLATEISGGGDMPAIDLSNAPETTSNSLPDIEPGFEEMPAEEGPAVDKRTPVPNEKSLADARKRLLSKFSANMERGRTADSKAEFAKQLRSEAAAASAEPAWHYVLLDKAVDLASEAAQFDLVVQTLEEVGKTFAIDTLKEKSIALNKSFQANNSPEQAAALHTVAYGLVHEAQLAKRYDAAETLADLALRTARRAKDSAAERQVNELIPGIRKQLLESVRFDQALARLKVDPADAAANTFLGRRFCLVDDNWRMGLPHLAKGNPGDLRDAAAADLANPLAAGEQASLADRWFKLGRSVSDDSRGPLLKRAKHWFELSLPQLSGAERTVAEERLKEIDALLPLAKF